MLMQVQEGLPAAYGQPAAIAERRLSSRVVVAAAAAVAWAMLAALAHKHQERQERQAPATAVVVAVAAILLVAWEDPLITPVAVAATMQHRAGLHQQDQDKPQAIPVIPIVPPIAALVVALVTTVMPARSIIHGEVVRFDIAEIKIFASNSDT